MIKSNRFVLWAKIDDNETGSEEFIDDILYHANVFITPGFIFGSNGERYIRISLGVSTERMQEAYRRIADYVEKQRTKKINEHEIFIDFISGMDNKRPLVVAGPCSAETEEQVMTTARQLAAIGIKIFRAGVWKPVPNRGL